MVDQAQQKRIFQKLVRVFYRPIYLNWLKIQFLNGNIKAPISELNRLSKAQYIGKKFTYYDFYKDIKAMELERKLGLKTLTKQLAEMGVDFEDHVNELKREDEVLKNAGFDSLRLNNLGSNGPASISDIDGELEKPLPEEKDVKEKSI